MPDQYEYFDEYGNRIDPADLDGSDYEVIDETTTAQPTQPPTPGVKAEVESSSVPRLSKGAIVGVLATVLVLGGGAAYGLSQIGNDDNATVADVRSKVETKKDEIVDDVRPELDACDGTQLADAGWSRGQSTPSKQLSVVESVPLPAGFVERSSDSDDPAETTEIVQFGDRSLGIYDYDDTAAEDVPASQRWWKVSVSTDPDVAVTGEEKGDGNDKDAATACTRVDGGIYRVIGDGIPAAAKEMQTDLVQVAALKGDGVDPTTVWVVAGDRLLKTTLEYTPTDDE